LYVLEFGIHPGGHVFERPHVSTPEHRFDQAVEIEAERD
jgi:hypothetical protein